MSTFDRITERIDEFVHEPLKVNINYPHDAYPTGPAGPLEQVKPMNPLNGR
jgi:hypothetical protein